MIRQGLPEADAPDVATLAWASKTSQKISLQLAQQPRVGFTTGPSAFEGLGPGNPLQSRQAQVTQHCPWSATGHESQIIGLPSEQALPACKTAMLAGSYRAVGLGQ